MKKSYTDSVFLVSAIILSLGFYALLFLPFQYQARVAPIKDKPFRHLADVVMLPLDKSPLFPWQSNLIASLELLDPTIMSLPNASYGFSNVRNLEFERPIKPLAPYQMRIDYAPAPAPSQFVATPPIGDLFFAMNSTHFLKQHTPQSHPGARLDSSVYWTNAAGDIQEYLPSISLKDVTTNGQKLTTLGPTQLEISYRGNLARVKVLTSCGISQLDKMAVDSLRRYFTREQAKLPASSSSSSEEGLEGNQVFAYWRFASEVRESANIHSKEKLYDWDWF